MMSLSQIQQLSLEAAVRAAKEKRQPLVIWPEDIKAAREGNLDALGTIPFIGSYVPTGWKLVDTLFVDISGFGKLGELALTQEQFTYKLKADFGYAIIDHGQFKAYVGVFEKRGKKGKVSA